MYKALVLLEFLLKRGPEDLASIARNEFEGKVDDLEK